ncbi:acyl-CoA dehydrogenase family protein [Amycolatopsis sp. NPDC051371]|uniref:acyl-CoA dehydrogenase family protein n=1 Tax=Amycolatopsis sp. NPDC051371 TaxID=3155800 RepID=UPI00343D5BBE
MSRRDDEVAAVAAVAAKFVESELVAHREEFERQHQVDRDVWRKAGELGLLCCSIPEQYGGGGGTFAHDLTVFEAQARLGETGWGNGVHSGIVAHARGPRRRRVRHHRRQDVHLQRAAGSGS